MRKRDIDGGLDHSSGSVEERVEQFSFSNLSSTTPSSPDEDSVPSSMFRLESSPDPTPPLVEGIEARFNKQRRSRARRIGTPTAFKEYEERDGTDTAVQRAAEFACSSSFGKYYKRFEIVEAYSEIVEDRFDSSFATSRYYLVVDVYFASNKPIDSDFSCSVEVFEVYIYTYIYRIVTILYNIFPLYVSMAGRIFIYL